MNKIPQEIIREEVLKYLKVEDWISLSLTCKENNMIVRKPLKEYVDFLNITYVEICKLSSYLMFYDIFHDYYGSLGTGESGDEDEKEEGYNTDKEDGHTDKEEYRECIEANDCPLLEAVQKLFFDGASRNSYRNDRDEDLHFDFFSRVRTRIISEEEIFEMLVSVVLCAKKRFKNEEYKILLKSVVNGIKDLNRSVYIQEYLEPSYIPGLCEDLARKINLLSVKEFNVEKLEAKHIYNRKLT
jgi:hypothetical protein